MNPSASGWIRKHLSYFLSCTARHVANEEALYLRFRESGFIYGSSICTLTDAESEQLKWTEEEKTKINLFDALVYTYYDTIVNPTEQDCIQTIINFYEFLNTKKPFFTISIGKDTPYTILEKIIQRRIQTNEPLLKKNFSHLITNALLYLDVLAFDHYLITDNDPCDYVTRLEATIGNTIWLALREKEETAVYDELLIKLFESSIRYNEDLRTEAQTITALGLNRYNQPLEQRYLLDLSCLAVWDDLHVDDSEYEFIKTLGKALQLPKQEVIQSLQFVQEFVKTHKDRIAYLNYSNPVKHFYKQTSRAVSTLVLRNKKRLIKEIVQSKDLVFLLGQSTSRSLTVAEKKQVKTQLMDICKSIPSLAIFLLPGGGILLPLLVKFIPQLLPSAFNENMVS